MFFQVLAKMQVDEFTVPVKGDVMVHGRLAEDIPDILYKTETQLL